MMQQTTLCHIRKDLPINNAKLIRDGRPTPSKICRPNYYIIGTPKGGTTSLHTYLTKHPFIYPFKISGSARDGESFTKLYKHGHTMAFINGTNSEGKEGITVHDNHLVGDATTQRLVGDAYTRLKRYTCPQSRIFILLRDPVERCYR